MEQTVLTIKGFEFSAGCYFDSHHGRYIGEYVIKLARKFGFKSGHHSKANCEYYLETWDDAERFLNNLIPSDCNYYFGSNPDSSDWGLWEITEEN